MGTTYLVLIMIIIFALGLTAGFLIGKGGVIPVMGSFTINHSDPTKDFCSLRLDADLDVLEKYQTFALKLDVMKDENEGKADAEKDW